MLISAARATAPHGDEHRLEVGNLVDQLQRNGALAGDDARVIEGMDEDEAALRFDLSRPRIGGVVVVAVEDDLGAVAPRRHHLGQGRPFRHHDDRRDAEARGVEGHGEPMVARAGRHHSSPPLVLTEHEQNIGSAALLEGARHLQVLELHEDARARQSRERLRIGAGSGRDQTLESSGGGADIVEGDGVAQNVRAGRAWPGVMKPTGMSGVE